MWHRCWMVIFSIVYSPFLCLFFLLCNFIFILFLSHSFLPSITPSSLTLPFLHAFLLSSCFLLPSLLASFPSSLPSAILNSLFLYLLTTYVFSSLFFMCLSFPILLLRFSLWLLCSFLPLPKYFHKAHPMLTVKTDMASGRSSYSSSSPLFIKLYSVHVFRGCGATLLHSATQDSIGSCW